MKKKDEVEIKATRLAALRLQMNKLKEEADLLQTDILTLCSEKKIETPIAVLTRAEKSNYKKIDNEEFIKRFGQESFNEIATLSVGAIKKFHGIHAIDTLMKDNVITVSSVSKYFIVKAV